MLSFFLAILALLNFDIESTANKLDNAYKHDDYKSFVEAFPTSFEDFLSLYGFNKVDGERKLYSEASDHIEYLFSDQRIVSYGKLDILIQLSYGFKWEADAPNYLHSKSCELAQTSPRQLADLLNNKNDADIISFFRMCLVGIFEDNITESYNDFVKVYSPISQRITELIKKAYILALEDSDKIILG